MNWSRSHGGFHAFGGKEIRDYVQVRERQVTSAVEQEQETYILQVNEQDYVVHLVDRFLISVPHLHFDEAYALEAEGLIPADSFPSGFSVFE